MTDLPHIAARLFATPLLMARPKLDVILNVLGPRLNGAPLEELPPLPSRDIEITESGIAIIPVTGTLVARSSYLAAASGLMSYSDIGDAIESAATDPRVRGLLLDIDSPGGEVGGLFDLADRIIAIREQTGKPIWAVANEAALSAAYAIACAGDVLIVTQTGEIGSIGVVAVHVDESNADRQAGMAWSFIHAGEKKTDGNPHEPLSAQARADIQADVDQLYERFVSLVAFRRKLTPDAVRATEAAVYRGVLAVQAGLADRVGTLRQAVHDLAEQLNRKPMTRGKAAQPSLIRKEPAMQSDTETEPLPEKEDAQPTIPPAAPSPDPLALAEQKLRAEYAELAGVAAQAGRLGIKIDVAEALSKGIKPDALRNSVLKELAERSDATALVATAPIKPAGESPIVKRAREAASKS
ncbi:Periplasmic serine protease [Rhodospirillaceae bacterium LM-1]|nr:Periplasmic serine protease [Rhodospirillaceae bacterium LM-1]